MEVTSRTGASWPALCATITPALGPELGATPVDQAEPGPEVHAHALRPSSAESFFLGRGVVPTFYNKIP